MKGNSKSNSKLGGIWLTVLLLTILVLASIALLGSFIKRYTAKEKNIIAVMADSEAISNEHNNANLPIGATPNLQPSWETSTLVDLFKNTYTDSEGNITVQSANGDKVIAPGTSNTYEFSLKNTGNISLDYTMNLEGIFKISNHSLPFYVRLSQGGKWLVGGENEWVHADEVKTLVEQATLPVGESITYSFEWQWPYESDDISQQLIDDFNDTLMSADANDTSLGAIAVNVNADFLLNVNTVSVVTPDAVAVMANGVSVVNELAFVATMLGLVLSSGIWLIILLFRRKICLVGVITPAYNGAVKFCGAKANANMGNFEFSKARFGTHTLKIQGASLALHIKSSRKEKGISFNQLGAKTVITVSPKTRSVTVNLAHIGTALTVTSVN